MMEERKDYLLKNTSYHTACLLAMNIFIHLDTWPGNWNGDEAPKRTSSQGVYFSQIRSSAVTGGWASQD